MNADTTDQAIAKECQNRQNCRNWKAKPLLLQGKDRVIARDPVIAVIGKAKPYR
jgi:hypothetical protein